MPWTYRDAIAHNRRATTLARKRLWARTANRELSKHHDEARAIRVANAVLDRAIDGDAT